MPELPEVETTRRGIEPHVAGCRVARVVLRRAGLRWPFPPTLADKLSGEVIHRVRRRAKYLLLDTERGSAIIHLGMSGSLRIVPAPSAPGRHDHVDICFEQGHLLRFNDPRRFGCLLWQDREQAHPLLAGLGPEPLSDAFDGGYLFAASRGRRGAVKTFLMDQAVVVGVGNIYAAEALFRAGIDPRRAAGRISRPRYDRLAAATGAVLHAAIARGGTTLRDFLDPDGAPGYFAQELQVYGREDQPCRVCAQPLRGGLIGQRASVWCPRCQR
jgi:formamidopyrimidine-DNA glycosylase